MEVLLKQCTTSGNVLFTVQDPCGRLLYRLWGNPGSLRGIFALLDETGRERARVLRVGTADMGVYEIRLYQGKRMHVVCQKATRKGGMLFQGKNWHIRGDLDTRSFDIVERGRVLMTHAPAWQGEGGFCYGVTLTGDETERLFCLCAAMIVDSMPQNPGRSLVPV